VAELTTNCPSCQKAHAFQERVPFRAECESCAADLHVCLACRFYDRFTSNECKETEADPVQTKDRSNLCEYFKPAAASEGGYEDEAARAKAKLEALFKKP
jgi:hypothetical protein